MNRFCFWKALLFTLLLGPVAGEDVVVTVYSSPTATVRDGAGRELGVSGRAFRLPLGSEDVVLSVEADGYKSHTVTLTNQELRGMNRIPAQGVLELKKESSPLPLAVAGVLVLGVVTLVAVKNRNGPSVASARTDIFERGELLGEGATALVYAATSTLAPEQSLAVKILKPECASDPTVKGRLLRSLESSKDLDHPGLVKVYACGQTEDGLPFILLERLHGATLEQYLKKNQRPETADVLAILQSLCSTLSYLHQRTIVHRDVKPENIFMTRESKVKLMDLEISRTRDSEDLTKTGVVVGTPYYLAPEQIRGEVSPQSDQYALGVILFEMLAGEKPFRGETSMELINHHLFTPLPSLRGLNPELTSLQEAVVNKMLAKDPDRRFPDLQEAWAALDEAFGENQSDDVTL